MKGIPDRVGTMVAVGLLAVLWAGCSGIKVTTHAYLGTFKYPATDPANVRILQAEPKEPKENLGEIILSAEDSPSRAALEKKLKTGAAELGADALFVVYDKTRIFPVVYVSWYGGPTGVSESMHRDIVGIAIKYK